MNLIPIKVECRAEGKADEFPVRFYVNDFKFEIREIADRWYQAQNRDEWAVSNYFKVETASHRLYILKHELKNDRWFLVTPEDPIIQFSAN